MKSKTSRREYAKLLKRKLLAAQRLRHQALTDPSLTSAQRQDAHRGADNMDKIVAHGLWHTKSPPGFPPAPRLNWEKAIAMLERGAQDERVSPETRANAARAARLMKARLAYKKRKLGEQ